MSQTLYDRLKPSTSYAGLNIAKTAMSFALSGSDAMASALTADAKADMLDDILQTYFMSRGAAFEGEIVDVRTAIIYVRGKKQTKAFRKIAIGGAKQGLQIAAVTGAATVGSIIPVLGTVAGVAGGMVAGASLGFTVTGAEHVARKTKAAWKAYHGTLGVHREQAAVMLMVRRQPLYDRADGDNPADLALRVILGREYDTIVAKGDLKRAAERMKSI